MSLSMCRKEILDGVEKIPVGSWVPATLIVYGKSSEVVLTNQRGEILLAAGQLQSGLLIVFAHDGYVHDYLKYTQGKPTTHGVDSDHLCKNMTSWLRKEACRDDILWLDSYSRFEDVPRSCKILIWPGDQPKDGEFMRKLTCWIEEGGRMVCGMCTWGYLQLHPDRCLEDLPLGILTKKIGVAFTDKCMSDLHSGFLLNTDNQAENAKLPKIIKQTKKQFSQLVSSMEDLGSSLAYLPPDVAAHYVTDFTNMLESLEEGVHYVPTKTKPVNTPLGKMKTTIVNRILLETGQYNGSSKAEGIHEFPGDFATPPELVTISGTCSCSGQPRYHPTGLYLPAGVEMTAYWSSRSGFIWNVVIGCHKDELYHSQEPWRRWPKVQVVKPLNKDPLSVSNPFGGLIYFLSPHNATDTLQYTVSNVTMAPLFTLDTAASWVSDQRQKPGLWTDICGQNITITLPSSAIRSLAEPSATVWMWDEVVASHLELRGKDPYEGRGQWIVTDEQPSVGYMHSGYPIVTHMDVADPKNLGQVSFLLLVPPRHFLKPTGEGPWGELHELGHNYQDPAWTWSGAGEVTVNIFTLYTMGTKCGFTNPWHHPWLRKYLKNARNYLKTGAKFHVWKQDPGLGLFLFAQLARDFSWDSYKAIFREYNKLSEGEKPKNDQEKIDQWIIRFSRLVNCTILPLFEFWGLPIGPKVKDEVKSLAFYLPEDETTQEMAPERAQVIIKKYKN